MTNLPYPWEEVQSEDGQVYYWNKDTDETSWEFPQLDSFSPPVASFTPPTNSYDEPSNGGAFISFDAPETDSNFHSGRS